MGTVKNNESTFDYRKSLKKSTDPFINKIKFIDIYLNRPVASLIVRAVYKTSVTPNQLTYISFFLGILGAFFFSRGEYLYFILGGVSAQLCSIVDGADGMLARAKNMCSDYGSHLDLFLDRIIDFSLFVGISLGAGHHFNDPHLLFLGVLSSGLYLLQTNLFYITKNYLQVKDKGETGEFRAVMVWAMLIFAIANRLDIFIYLGAAETVIVNIARVIYFISLGKKKNSSLIDGFEHTQQSHPGQQQGKESPDQHQG
jgi:phosphatidylglycerophosphate synthase